jgi:hypothetical protein
LWTRQVFVQVLVAACFVLIPTLLMRIGHPALCAHWLLLWAIWLYLRPESSPRSSMIHTSTLGLVAGLVHPYLAVMVLALAGAVALRNFLAARDRGVVRASIGAVSIAALALTSVVTGWWASGLFTVSGVNNLASEGLGKYSMNLLALVTPTGWSRFLPEWPLGAEGQSYEGFHYLGAGLILLVVLGIAARLTGPRRAPVSTWWPLVVACLALGLYALSPRVTLGAHVVADLHIDWLERASIFRATSRFFWPAGYVLVTAAAATLITRIPARVLVPMLAAVVLLQLADLHDAHTSRRNTRLNPAWWTWPAEYRSPVWHAALPHYDRVVMYPPTICSSSSVKIEPVAFLAGTYGLTLNGGLVARFDEGARRAACEDAARAAQSGVIDPRTVYLGDAIAIDAFRAAADKPVVCGSVDNVSMCVDAGSYARWRGAASLE